MILKRDDLPSGTVSVLKKILRAVGSDGKVYLYGGWLRDFVLRELGEEVPSRLDEKDDLDIVIVSDLRPIELMDRIISEFPEDLGGIPHPDSLRLFFDKFKMDITVYPSLKGKVYDFTVDTLYVDLEELLEKGKGEISSVHGGLSDLRRKVLRVVKGFSPKDYPHHTLRGLRFIALYGFVPTPATKEALKEGVKVLVKDPNYHPLIHTEISETIHRGGPQAIEVLDEYDFFVNFFPPLKELRKRKEDASYFSDRYEHSILVTQVFLSLVMERETLSDRIRKIIRRSTPKELLEKGLAPANRDVLYSFTIASLLHDIKRSLPDHAERGAEVVLELLTEKGFYPMERLYISLCVYHHHDIHGIVKGEKTVSEVKKVHPIVLSFLIPFTLADFLTWFDPEDEDFEENLEEYLKAIEELID